MTTLKITIGEGDTLHQQTLDRLDAVEQGEELDDTDPVLNVASFDELSRLLSPVNLELLEVIAKQEPASIRETARLVDRDYKEVHRNLSELEDIGILTFESAGEGQPKRPKMAYDALEIDIPLLDSGHSLDAAAP